MSGKLFAVLIAFIALVGFGGCGGGGGDDDAVKVGTAYYLDSPVIGARYYCGSHSGLTGSEGDFVFEYGRGCTLGVGGITLRVIEPRSLHDGRKIVEIDNYAARLLQSLDYDGNPDNGIYIAPEVDKAMMNILASYGVNPDDILENNETLAGLLELIRLAVPGFSGWVKGLDEAMAHVCSTVEKVTNELFRDRTFYRYCSNGTDEWMETYRFEVDGTLYIERNGDVTTLKYGIDKFNVIFYGEISKTYALVETTENSLTLQDEENNYLTLYYSADAAKKYGPESCGESRKVVDDIASVIVGKTYYFPIKEGYAHVRVYEFGSDGATLTVAWKEEGTTYSETLSYEIGSNFLRIYGDTTLNGQKVYINRYYLGPVTVTDDYIQFSFTEDRFYTSYDLAYWALVN